ncbi:MAG: hypothetical protein HY770_02355 [Chitinivibrionia bacterium]|nr:hypothetical protein [Chitinivibrionia bacterium]
MKKQTAIMLHITRRAVFVCVLLCAFLSIHFLSAFPVSPPAPGEEEIGGTPKPDSPDAPAYPGDVFWDARFGAFAPNARVYAIAIDSNYVYIGGEFTKIGNVSARGIAKWDGHEWSAVGGGVDGWVRTIEIYQGIVYVGGSFKYAGDVLCNDIARWDGARWRSFGSGVVDPEVIPSIQDIAVFKGEVYIGGGFRRVGGLNTYSIAKWNKGWHALGSGVSWSAGNPGVVYALAADSNYLYIGGGFLYAGGTYMPHLVKWDGNNYSPIEAGAEVTGSVLSLAMRGGELIAGGEFRVIRAGCNSTATPHTCSP